MVVNYDKNIYNLNHIDNTDCKKFTMNMEKNISFTSTTMKNNI